MMILSQAIRECFWQYGWAQAQVRVRYGLITKVVNEFLISRGGYPKRSSTIDRIMRKEAQRGIFFNIRGEFQANLEHPAWKAFKFFELREEAKEVKQWADSAEA